MKTKKKSRSTDEKAMEIIQNVGGIIRTSDALRAGIHSRTIYALHAKGELEQISRGVYRLISKEELLRPDLTTIAIRIPRAVLCLVSALSFHEITTQIPHKISIALPKGTDTPRLNYPPIEIHRYSNNSYTGGIEVHQFNGVSVKVYCPEKTLADCFKFRNKIGHDIVLESLKLFKTKMKFNPKELLKYARICRVENIMRPYLEAIL